MHVITNYLNTPDNCKGSVVAIGNFDGVHIGHQKVIGEAINIARRTKNKSAILTFTPHPLTVLRPDLEHFILMRPEQKQQKCLNLGIDIYFEIQFDQKFSRMNAEDFVYKVIINQLKASHVVIGHDFIFGYKRSGNAEFLQDILTKNNVGFTQVKSVGDEEVYSSSLIRKMLKHPNLERVKQILGHNHKICGKIIKGNQMGSKLGFPTANIELDDLQRPAYGVYRVNAYIDGLTYQAIANIGNRPTLDGNKEFLEIHILDYNKDIYGKNVEVELLEFIRPEQKFGSINALKKQIQEDVALVRKKFR